MLQPEAPAASSLHGTPRAEEEDDGDLNKALSVQRFQQILSPGSIVPDEQHHSYHDEDIECKRTHTHSLSSTFKIAPANHRVSSPLRLLRRPPSLVSPHPPASVQTALRGTQEEGRQEEEEGERSQKRPRFHQWRHRGGRGWRGRGGGDGGDGDRFCSVIGENQRCGGNSLASY